LDVRTVGEKDKKQPQRPLDVVYVDFKKSAETKGKFKQWVNEKTKGVIKDADIEVDQDTEMILASTIYFKGQWLFSFNKTEKIQFEGVDRPVDAMKIKKKYHSGNFDNLPARWAAIPYNSTEALVIVLPNEGENIDELIANMTGSEMTEIIDDLAGYPTSNWLTITIPKFKINSKIDLKEPLQKMGIKKIFTPESELYLYEGGRALRVGAANQQSSLEIDEAGSIGASATAFSGLIFFSI
jgi:serpin B